MLVAICLLAAKLPAQALCDGQPAANLLGQGDFGSGPATVQAGDPFLSPDFSYGTASLAGGTYILASTSELNTADQCWAATGDNSGNNQGYFLLAHTTAQAGILYEKTIEVCDGMTYILTADLINLSTEDCAVVVAPEFEFLVNGQSLQALGPLPQDASWNEFSASFEVENGTDLLSIGIRYATVGAAGHIIGLDNVSLRPCGPVLELPLETSFCEGNGVVLSLVEEVTEYSNPYFQWQRSFDGGNSWQDIPNAQTANLYLDAPIEGVQYRVWAANGPVNFLNENCRVVSNATQLRSIAPITYYQTPAICSGDTLLVGVDRLSSAGEYLSILPASSGCDSLVYTFLFTYPSYDQLYAVSLCPGESFRGQTYFSSTSFEEQWTTVQGCDSLVRFEIEVFGEEVFEISGNTSLCQSGSTTLTAPAAYLTYAWSTGADSREITVDSPGDYSLTVTNSAGCELSTSVVVETNDLFFIAESTDPSCPEFSDGEIEVMLVDGGAGPYEYRLDEAAWGSAPRFGNLSGGEYRVSVRDDNGCEVEQQIFLMEASALSYSISGLPVAPIDMGDTVFLEAMALTDNVSFEWSGDGLFACRTCPNTSWVPLGNGRLQLLVQSAAGCSTQVDTLIDLRDRYRVYFPTAFSPNGDGNNDAFLPGLGSNVQRILTWEIYDRWGGRLFAAENHLPDDPGLAWDGSWRGQMLDSGYYLYRAEIEFVNGQSRVFAGEVYLMK